MNEEEDKSYYPPLSELREWEQVSLETFTLVLENDRFDESVNDAIESLKKEEKEIDEKIKEFPATSWESFVVDSEIYTPSESDFEKSELTSDLHEIREKLKALAEMKIIYAFKFLEINIKKVLSRAYDLKNSRSFFQWKSINDFLLSKNILLNNVKGYQEIYQLKQINNSLKHSERIEEKILKTAFNASEYNKLIDIPDVGKIIDYETLLSFYERVNPYIEVFLENLCQAIYNERYVFNKEKLEQMAWDLGRRMEESDAMELIKMLKKYY